jgi:hypothetical protein
MHGWLDGRVVTDYVDDIGESLLLLLLLLMFVSYTFEFFKEM